MGEFGDKFRKAREKKEISLDDVSNVTKISARMLQAIEQEHFDQLPGGVFNKGFIRAYAKHLGLNDEEAVTDYLACLRQAQIDAHEVWEPERPRVVAPPVRSKVQSPQRAAEPSPVAVKPQPAPPQVDELPDLQLPRAEHVRPGRKDFGDSSTQEIPWKLLAVAAVVIVLGIMLWMRRSHNANTAGIASNTVQAKTTPQPVSSVAPTNQPSSTATLSSGFAPAPGSQPTTRPVVPSPASTSSAPTEKKDPEEKTEDKNDVTVRTSTKANSTAPEKPAPVLTLVIRATETSWISVLADGQPASQETLIAPAHASIRANREIVARIGNAAGVTFLWNGQEIPADGAEAEVKTFVFDGNGMRVLPNPQSPAPNQ